MSDKTVHMLKIITTDVRRPFVIAGIVDRMAAMLNYVLKHLVGKASKNFKVMYTMQAISLAVGSQKWILPGNI